VVAGVDLAVDAAVEAGEAVIEHDGAVIGDRVGDDVEAVFDGAGKLSADGVVVIVAGRDELENRFAASCSKGR
jgi:microcompartment protein CcmL/EutN